MKYFKPELLACSRSPDDDVAEAAAQEWELAASVYNVMLDKIRPSLPRKVKFLLDQVSLHDANILGIAVTKGRPSLSLFMRLEGKPAQPGAALELTYILLPRSTERRLALVRHGKLTGRSAFLGRIMYDEFGMVGDIPEQGFSHSLLLANGCELRIQFTKLLVRPLKRLILPRYEQAGLRGLADDS